MHAIYPLISGIQGGAAGTVRIYVRGTTVRAPYWLDFEATQQVANTTDISLDSNGGAEVYVGQLVDVTVFDASGNEVRSFVAGSEAPNIEVRSQGFLGVDYITGASAAGNPTTLQAVLDKALTSFGSTDWKVLISAVPTLLSTALAGVTGIVFNVKSPTYGAAGNGTTDDTAAIQAAITAATVSGGTVVFPPGTYRFTATLSMATNVNLQGVGAAASVLKLDHATNHGITWTSATASQKSVIAGLGFIRAVAGSGVFVMVDARANLRVLIDECTLDGFTFNCTSRLVGGQSGGYAGMSLEIYRSQLLLGTGDGVALGSGTMRLVACRLRGTTGAFAGTFVQQLGTDGLCVALNDFDASPVASGAFNYLFNTRQSANGQLGIVVANAFVSPTGGTGTVGLSDAAEVGNAAGSAVLFTADVDGTATYSYSSELGRERTYRRVASVVGAYTMPDGDGTTVFSQNFAGNCVMTTPTFYPGRRGRLYVHNQDGTNRSLVFTASASVFAVTGAGITINTATYTQVDWEMVYMNGHAVFRYWVTDANRIPP